jgi:hypothetical protein
MFDYVTNCATASLFVEISADSWAIAIWSEDEVVVEGGNVTEGRWPHGIAALARYADLLTRYHAHPAGGQSMRGLIRRASVTVPHACGVDWLPEEMRLMYALAFVANARDGK